MALPWTDERREQCFKLWADGWSATQIAKEMKAASRNAVLGVIHRAGKAERAPPSRPGASKAPRAPKAPKAPTASKPDRPMKLSGHPWAPGVIVGETRPPTPVVAIDDAFAPLPGTTPRTLFDRPDRGCTWTVGENGEGEALYCSEPSNGRWCDHHNAINRAKAPKVKSGAELARGLRRYV